MKILVVLCVIGLANAFPKSDWEMFKTKHGKTYKSAEEEQYRMKIFFENKRKIDDHNARFQRGEVTFDQAINQFGDLTAFEVKSMMNGLKNTTTRSRNLHFVPSYKNIADSVDWREKGAVTPVRQQGECGSCWAFSAAGSLEGQVFMKTGKLVPLSVQNLVDCSRNYDNEGCDGGTMNHAFTYIQENEGIDTEDSYPYEAKDGECRFQRNTVGGSDVDYVEIPSGDEEALKHAIATIGPISVSIDSGHESFIAYKSGIYMENECTTSWLDHAVLAVGYGSENGLDYWLVKNSWGSSWGEQGYIRMARNKHNHCGIATTASYPVV